MEGLGFSTHFCTAEPPQAGLCQLHGMEHYTVRRGELEKCCGLLKGGRIGYLFRPNRLKYLETWRAYVMRWHGVKELRTGGAAQME